MYEKIPTAAILIALLGMLLAGPVVVFSFLLGGVTAGMTAAVVLSLCGVALYIIAVRHYGEQ